MTVLTAVRAVHGSPAGEVARLGAWLEAVRARADALEGAPPAFLVVTPLALPWRGWLAAALASLGVIPRARIAVPRWSALSSVLYVRRPDTDSLRRGVRFERAWEARFPDAPAEAWSLASCAHARAHMVKGAVRACLPHVRVTLDGRDAVLHPFHLADPDDAGYEARLVLAVRSLSSESW